MFKHFHVDRCGQWHVASDAGLILELADGRIAVSQTHDRTRPVQLVGSDRTAHAGGGMQQPLREALDGNLEELTLSVEGPLDWARFELVTPLKNIVLRAAMLTVGRWCRTLVRRLLQRRLITGRRQCRVTWSRSIELLPDAQGGGDSEEIPRPLLRITDRIELCCSALHIKRMSYGVDHQAAYVAASGVYQDGVLQPWTDLGGYVAELNARRRVTIVREV
jgi:hypothetical protein